LWNFMTGDIKMREDETFWISWWLTSKWEKMILCGTSWRVTSKWEKTRLFGFHDGWHRSERRWYFVELHDGWHQSERGWDFLDFMMVGIKVREDETLWISWWLTSKWEKMSLFQRVYQHSRYLWNFVLSELLCFWNTKENNFSTKNLHYCAILVVLSRIFLIFLQ
jgi:hypothetical protein